MVVGFALIIALSAFVVLPATASPGNKALHGTWKVTSVKAGHRTMPSDPKVGVWWTIKDKVFEFKVTYGSETMQKRNGVWSSSGTSLLTRQKGETEFDKWQFKLTKDTLILLRRQNNVLVKTTFKRIVKKR